MLIQKLASEAEDIGLVETAAPAAPASKVSQEARRLRHGDRSNLFAAITLLADRDRKRRHLRAIVFTGDLAALLLAFAIAGMIRLGHPGHDQVWSMLMVVVPTYLTIAMNQHAYHRQPLIEVRGGVRNSMAAFLLTMAVVSLAVFFMKVSEDFSRIMFATGSVLGVVLLPTFRFAIGRAMRGYVGDSHVNEVVIEDGLTVPQSEGLIVLSAERDGLKPVLHDPDALDRLGRSLRHADRVVIACPAHRRSAWAMALKGADVEAEVLAPELDELGVLGLGRLGDRRTFVVTTGPLGRLDRTLKRALDLTLVLLVLPFVGLVMLAVAIAIKLDSRGPVLFRQTRVGLGNRLFTLYKFRSMHVQRLDGDGVRSTGRDDDRITRVGRFIRRTSLDELPQVLNVLFGTMSIVGPRPHALGSTAEDKLFWDIDSSYWHRHAVAPGMTGLAQIRGLRGATERIDDLRDRLQADLEYVNGWTIWRDVRIIAATFRVLIHRNAF